MQANQLRVFGSFAAGRGTILILAFCQHILVVRNHASEGVIIAQQMNSKIWEPMLRSEHLGFLASICKTKALN